MIEIKLSSVCYSWQNKVLTSYFLRTSYTSQASLRCDILSSFQPNWMKFEHNKDKVLLLVLLMANLQNESVNSLVFADKLHKATMSDIFARRYLGFFSTEWEEI